MSSKQIIPDVDCKFFGGNTLNKWILLQLSIIFFLNASIQPTKSWKGVKASRTGIKITNLFFTDDVLLFGEGTERQARVMREAVEEIWEASGQKANLHKSKLLFVPKMQQG